MLKEMKKIMTICVLLIIASFSLTACAIPGPSGPVEITEDVLEDLSFENKTVEYNGEKQGIYIDNIYADRGVEITYSNNDKTEPGTYMIKATIKYNDITVQKKAFLTIIKHTIKLEAEEVQTVNISREEVSIDYTVDNETLNEIVILNENGEIIELESLKKPGVYNVEIYVKGAGYYDESNHIKITLNVIKSEFDLTFSSKKVIADGTEQKVEIEGTLPSGYSVSYSNNTGIDKGNYLAVAEILNENNEVVETHRAALIIDNPENAEFKAYLDEFFIAYLEGDQLSVNIFCENPADFGLEHYEASWYSYESFDESAIEHDVNLFKELLAELEEFKDAPLNTYQVTAYETIRKFIEKNIEYYSIEDSFFMEVVYVDQFGGYVADFGTYMEAYSLRTEAEVQDVVDYIESTKEAFPSYLDFVQDKVDKGYGLSDYTLNEMITYLSDILVQGENYYLKDILHTKIDEVDFLTNEQKENYKEQINVAVRDCFVVGVQELYDGLDDFLGNVSSEEEGYLTKYENGQELYLHELGKLTGYDLINSSDYIAELDTALKSSISQIISTQQAIVSYYGITTWAELEQILAETVIFDGAPEEMLAYLKEFAKTIVPELKSEPEIVVKQMDLASAKVSNAVAYYMKSALDNTGAEYITLNPVQLNSASKNDVLGTLAHEGYPGHLYAYVYAKELGLSNVATIMTNVGHAEGWATYVELELYDYAKEMSSDAKFDIVMDYLYANALSGFLLETRLDAGIHLEGWTVEQVGKYMDSLGYSSDSAEYIYDLLIEIPTQYASYGYGKLVFNNLHTEAKEILGVYYDEVEFNAMLLSKGWTDLQILEQTYEEYMIIKCHENGIAYN